MPDEQLSREILIQEERLEKAQAAAWDAIAQIAELKNRLSGLPPKPYKDMPGYIEYVKDVMKKAEQQGEGPLTWAEIMMRIMPIALKKRDHYPIHRINQSKTTSQKRGTIIIDELGLVHKGPKFDKKNLLDSDED